MFILEELAESAEMALERVKEFGKSYIRNFLETSSNIFNKCFFRSKE